MTIIKKVDEEEEFKTRWEWCSNQDTNEWSLFESKIQTILNDALENKLKIVIFFLFFN